jgi:cell division initiation protein
MKVTPLDIRQKQFPRRLRGLDAKEVEAFIELVGTDFEDVIRENLALKDEIKRQVQRIEEYRERERTLQETMVTAQRITEDLKDAAKRQAEVVVSDAELQAERIIQNAHTRMVQILDEIGELKRQRSQFESGVKSLVEAHLKLLEVFKGQPPAPHVGENVEFFSKKAGGEG